MSETRPSKQAAQGGGEPPATGMARDYDYLFKLLIIGDSGKPTPGMRDGKWAQLCFFFTRGEEEMQVHIRSALLSCVYNVLVYILFMQNDW